MLGETGPVSVYDRGDIKTVVLEVPGHSADELLNVLSEKDTTISYRVMEGTATPSVSPTSGSGRLIAAIPVNRFTMGSGPLAKDDQIDLRFYIPNAEKTPVPVDFLVVKVVELYSNQGPITTGNWEAVKTILVEFAADQESANAGRPWS